MASRHHHVEGFNISVNTKRAFSFEELQSGAYFNSLDESDHQFYGMYGQPVLIPLPEDSGQEGWSLQGYTHMHSCGDSPSYSTTAVHYTPHSNPRVHQVSKSYTLVGSLGDLSPSTYIQAPSGAAQITRVSATARHSGKNGFKHESGFIQQSCGDLVYPSDFPSSPALHHPRQRYTHEGTTPAGLLNHLGRGSEDAKLLDDEPPMDHLPYPPPTQTPSSYEFQPYSPPEMTTSPSPYSPQSPALMVPSQSYMFEGESSTPAFIHTNQQHYHSQNESPSHTHGDSTESPSRRSPSPRGACRISPPPHQKRSMDKKPALACLFCRGRKIACGPPVLGNKDRTCNQCARRHLKCEYPLESRRGMRKRRSLVPRASGSPPPEINSSGPKVVKSGRKRSVDKRS
ncbi:hypothetical protein K503DRAFT_715893 [Rhizopogon vinicolor AM-OR11-026]|uniref:Zn(2)-C6 fungal-type domain-containing protein n=1 Tax=Rhizopogon vinicolor AM-OR11-026 TaxID=1314800 RepID=A0A1B7N4E6_9AGAM|nr:hypothetical protein K503DRAFT_715893 [Rhizopogon vinicolor AM-OR11-026]